VDHTIAITGAAGFIGRALVARLAADGERVVGIDRIPSAPEDGRTEHRSADVTDAAALGTALAGATHVIHTAAAVAEYGPMAEFVRVNVGGTRNVLDAAAALGVTRVVHLSSVAVWGYTFTEDLPEDAPPRPCGNPYIDTKGASELLALERGATVVRPGDVYGPGSRPWIVRPLATMRAGLFRLPGRGDGIITPVYVDDLVDAVVRALRHPDAAGAAFTAHDGHPVPARDFFAFHARMLGKDRAPRAPRPLVVGSAAALEAIARLRGRPPVIGRAAVTFVSRRAAYPNTRAREILGWEPRVELAEGMRRSEAWARAEGLLP
jgi:nucleoside-diphosphate-sugar epimerase